MVIEIGAVRQTIYDFLLVRHYKYSSILHSFNARQHTDARDIDIADMSIRLSVRPSVRNVQVSDENGLTDCQVFSLYAVYGSPINLV